MTRKSKKTPLLPGPLVNGVRTAVFNLAEVRLPKYSHAEIRTSNKPWVNYGGVKNNFPDFLIDSIEKSSRHSAYVSLRENCIKGGKIGPVYSGNIKEFLENIDQAGGSFRELLGNWATDLSILETFACFVRYNKRRDKIAAIDFIDSSKLRVGKVYATPEQAETGIAPDIQTYYLCDDWGDTSRNPPVAYPRFNPYPRNAAGDIVKPSNDIEVFYYRKRQPKQPYYPYVSYISCLNYVESQYELSKYGLNTLLNGFFASSLIRMIAPSWTEEQQDEFKAGFNRKFTGSENNSQALVIVSENADMEIDVKPLTTGDNTPLIETIRTQAEQAIDVAHRCQPALIGVPSNGGLQSDGKLIATAQEQFIANVIDALQAPVLDFMNKVLIFNGFKGYELDIANLNLVKDASPEWFEQSYVKTEALARKYNWKVTDIKPELLTADPAAAAPTPTTDAPADQAQVQDPTENVA